jgi:enoyl-CoA hydratase/carnithine racemase
MIDLLTVFPKPLIVAINGIGVGIGATILGYADLAFMSSAARLRCPFTSLGVAPGGRQQFHLPAAHRPAERHVGLDELRMAIRR